MANPQRENGHVDIANELVEVLAKTRLSGYESRVLWALWRKTWGWVKKDDKGKIIRDKKGQPLKLQSAAITSKEWEKLTGLNKYNISRTLRELNLRQIVIKFDNKNRWGFQKDYDQWLQPFQKVVIKYDNDHSVIKNDNEISKNDNEISKNDNKIISKSSPDKGFPNAKETLKETLKENKETLRFEIIEYLNKITGKKFKPDTPATIKCINARLKEGFNLNDFKYVIDVKWDEWKDKITKEGKNMEDWMRPITLFSTKFESYLNQGKPDPYEKYYRKE
jgi:phage replication O-like protein O